MCVCVVLVCGMEPSFAFHSFQIMLLKTFINGSNLDLIDVSGGKLSRLQEVGFS